ncbi:MAG: sugar ABC transporter permease [Alicyclobacillus sp.]|nr:sugar ABC transporter permease [Alicyclobacillus sp.]
MFPFLILFCFWVLFPLLYSAFLSFFARRMGQLVFVGIQNYITAFQDSQFWEGLRRVLFFGVVEVTCMVVISLTLALLLDTPYAKAKNFFRLLYFLPYAVPGVVATIMWGFLYTPNVDPILSILGGGPQHPLNPTAGGTLLYAIINIVLWEAAGYNMTLYSSALTSVPLELYDAARIDGCSELGMVLHVKLPLIRQTIIMTLVLSIIGAMQLFNEPFLLSQLVPIPLAYTPNSEIYNMAFTVGSIPYSATLSVVLGGISIIATVGFLVAVRIIGQRRERVVMVQKEVY